MSVQVSDGVAQVPADGPSEAFGRSALPVLTTAKTPDEVVAIVRALAQQGKAPGFEVRPGGFHLRAFGDPFDHRLEATVEGRHGSRISLAMRLVPKLPLIFLVVAILTVQPGMWLTDSMLKTYSTWYASHVQTWWWYVPLVILPMPFMGWRMWKKSKVAAADHARELVERLAASLGATVHAPAANDRAA
ncbi:MAG: hypothetical protein L6Q35_06370 [Phycisphaerales bacterium]|nr:hypothetical protein [Phycisphaerales bacterium]